MDYKKAYEETISKLMVLRDDWASTHNRAAKELESAFPELKESEDERIRKSLVAYFVKFKQDDMWDADFSFGNIVHWLEKQGGKGVVLRDTFGYEEGKQRGQEEGIMLVLDEPWKYGLEKQGSQNLANSAKTCKVEPKFKVGDWVINTITNEVEQVIELTGCEYICSGHLIVSFNEQHLLKRWTIEDAKDGDVLSSNDGHGNDSIELIKSITDKKIEFWFCLTNGNRYEVFDGITPYTNLASRKDATPATEEQCDQLEKAMADAGYRWNPDEKKMEKIAQNPAWSEEDIATISRVISIVKWAAYSDHSHPILNDKGATELVERLNSLKERYTWMPSDEQMKALGQAVKYQVFANPKRKEAFEALFNDLKKLTE